MACFSYLKDCTALLRTLFSIQICHFCTAENAQAEEKAAQRVEREATEVYAAVRPDGAEPAWAGNIPELRPTLRPYQSRALHWMVQRERSAQVRQSVFASVLQIPHHSASSQPCHAMPDYPVSMKRSTVSLFLGKAGGSRQQPTAPAVAGGVHSERAFLPAAGVWPGQPAALPAAAACDWRHAGR